MASVPLAASYRPVRAPLSTDASCASALSARWSASAICSASMVIRASSTFSSIAPRKLLSALVDAGAETRTLPPLSSRTQPSPAIVLFAESTDSLAAEISACAVSSAPTTGDTAATRSASRS